MMKNKKIIMEIKDRDIDILKMRFGLDTYEGKKHTYIIIGEKHDISRERVRQVIFKSIKKMRQLSQPNKYENLLKCIEDSCK